MGKTLHFDCFSGVSGDMVLGALIDLGLPLDELRRALGSLPIEHGTIRADRVLRAGVSATKFRLLEPAHVYAGATSDPGHEAHPTVDHRHTPRPGDPHHADHHGHHDRHEHQHSHGDEHGHHHHAHDGSHEHSHATGPHGHHSLREIEEHINRSALSSEGKARAAHLFERLAEAEAAIHDMPIERVHLHEVGALDSIVDIVGAVFGLEWLGAATITSSPVNVGSGTVRCAHGIYPVPAPATTRLLTGVPIYSQGPPTELTTPTGALIVTEYATSFGPMPAMQVAAIGYGAGDKDLPAQPNVLRLLVGESGGTGTTEQVVTIECEIDDMNPQLFGPLMDRLYAAGALDVYYAPVQMKKNRPGILVTVIAPPERRAALSGVLFTDTTTIGVRYQEMLRERLEREVRVLETPVGPIRFKVAHRGGTIVNASPEFEDCARSAGEHGLAIKEVQAIATKAWLDRGSV